MEVDHQIMARLGVGVMVVAGLLFGAEWVRSREWGGVRFQRLLQGQLQYGLAGAVAGYAAPQTWQLPLVDGVHAAVYFLVAWFGLVTGMGLDRRLLSGSQTALMVQDVIRAVVVALTVLLAAYAGWRVLAVHLLPVEAVFVLAGVCAALSPRLVHMRITRTRTPARSGWFSLATCTGALVYGVGAIPLRGGGFDIQLPLLPDHRLILIEATPSQMIGCLILGCLTGLIMDLLTRDAQRRMLVFLVGSSLAFGAGIAVALGLDPVWTGIVAGAWLINSTLRRLEIMQSLDRADRAARIGLYLGAGWLVGTGVAMQGISLFILAGVLFIVTVVRSLGLWGGTRSARWLLESGWIQVSGKREGDARLHVGILALALAVSLVELLHGDAGIAALAGVMASQWIVLFLAPVQNSDRYPERIRGRAG